jgi:hypothetical protein
MSKNKAYGSFSIVFGLMLLLPLIATAYIRDQVNYSFIGTFSIADNFILVLASIFIVLNILGGVALIVVGTMLFADKVGIKTYKWVAFSAGLIAFSLALFAMLATINFASVGVGSILLAIASVVVAVSGFIFPYVIKD